MCKIYGYCRVSTSEQSAKQDYERQKYLFEKSGIEFDEMFEEHISGGIKGDQREQFNKMLEKLQPSDIVCFSETSRFGRNYIDCFEMVDLITQGKKATVRFLSNGIELKGGEKMNPYTWLTISNFFIMDEFLKRQIGYNTSNALQAKKARGEKVSRFDEVPMDKKQEIITLRKQGLSMQAIADKMHYAKSTVCKIINQ